MSNDNAPWFRLRGDKWKADTRGLNPQEKAVYIDLLVEMHEREAPLSDAWLEQVRSITRARPKTFFAGIEKLIALGLFVRTDDGLWSHFMASEIANRRGRSEKARRSANKSRQNPDQNPDFQPEKSQQNQRSGAAIEIQTEMKREAPKGASHHTNSYQDESCSGGAASADAGGPPTGEGAALFAGQNITADATDDRDDDQHRCRLLLDEILSREAELGDGAMGDHYRRLARGVRAALAKHGHLSDANIGTIEMLVERLEAADRTKRGGADTVRRSGAKSREARR